MILPFSYDFKHSTFMFLNMYCTLVISWGVFSLGEKYFCSFEYSVNPQNLTMIIMIIMISNYHGIMIQYYDRFTIIAKMFL